MPTLSSARLLLPELPLSVVQERLEQDSFSAGLVLPDGPLEVTFPASWPGDALPIFPELLRSGGSTRQFVLIDRFLGLAVGLMGSKGGPDEHGDLEIGYGLNPECWGQGYATEALQALLPHWQVSPGVRRVTAETSVSNVASGRVLEKCGFVQVGEDWNQDDGPLLVWATVF